MVSKADKAKMHELYIELVKLQREIIASGLKLLILLEGRDAAGKDGTVKRLIKHLSPRETRVVALNKPDSRETTEWYFQRYTEHLPAAGEFVIFNRSWYNRAGVEKVMGFCSDEQYHDFMQDVALFEEMLCNSDIMLIKYYLDISKKEQKKRLDDRRKDPLKQWKISPIDKKAQKHWDDYSEARDMMLDRTDFNFAPWYVVDSENKDAMHLELIQHLLSLLEYKDKNEVLLSGDLNLINPVRILDLKKDLYQ
ncbi:MAG: polyphosphate kinase 2 [Bacteroidetes bacterium]|nr:polyphosphate kinase 2 [Bacteroidota bacterium]